jgi:hypothetical protein
MEIRYHINKIVRLVFVLLFMFLMVGLNFSYAANLGDAFDSSANKPLNSAAIQGGGYSDKATFESIIGQIITTALGLIGVIFLILAIYGGYTWMTAHGNDEMVEKARKTIVSAVIGLIIVLAAYAISRYIVSTIGDKTLNNDKTTTQLNNFELKVFA